MLAAAGYPDAPRKGAAITIPDDLPEGVTVFHAGTTRDQSGVLRANGGRVLTVTAVAPTFAEAQRRSREASAGDRVRGQALAAAISGGAKPPGGGARRTLTQVLDSAAMPELPEVETIVRDIRPALLGRRIVRAALSHDDVLRGVTRRRLLQRLQGADHAGCHPTGQARGDRARRRRA